MKPLAVPCSILFVFCGLLCAQNVVPSSRQFHMLQVPGSTYTVAYGLNKLGQIVGAYVRGSGSGFLYDSGTFTTISDPLGSSTVAAGINDAGVIVGYSTAGGCFSTITSRL